MTTTVTLIRGDGIAAELMYPVINVLEAARADLTFEEQPAGRRAFEQTGDALPPETIASIRRTGLALKGKLRSHPDDPYPSPNWQLRKELDLYAAVMPIRNLGCLAARHHHVDMVVIREAIEDIYAGLEHVVRDGMVASLKVVTADASKRITRFAFDYARANQRRKVTLVHKANIMKVTDGLFIECAEQVAKEYQDIEFNKLIVDNACMQLLLRPQQFDVALMGNLYGGIMSDLGAGVVGGISATMGASFGDNLAIFEAVHGDAAHLEGTGKANPLPLLMPACYLLEHLGQVETAERIREAVCRVLGTTTVTPDLGGNATTSEMLAEVAKSL
jgi:isocitrate dehydrogenase (NAD+)